MNAVNEAEFNALATSILNGICSAVGHDIERIGTRVAIQATGTGGWQFGEVANWVSGFWPGLLWLCHLHSKDPMFSRAARVHSGILRQLLETPERHDHDLGFQFSLSNVAEYRISGDETAREAALTAAASLLSRFVEKGGYLRAWNDNHMLGEATRGKAIIDSLENLPLLFWAAQELDDERYYLSAKRHAETLAQHIVRDDFSTYHTFDFDPDSGEPLRGMTFQGFSDESCWSRGQAWAIHGYTQVFMYTGEQQFLNLAKSLAGYAIERLDTQQVPPWDFSQADVPNAPRDSSAGAIMAAGFRHIAALCPHKSEADNFRNAAQNLLRALHRQCDHSNDTNAPGLLSDGAADVRRDLYNLVLPYGDYFYTEAWLRCIGHEDFFW